jgi:hypothetical protein
MKEGEIFKKIENRQFLGPTLGPPLIFDWGVLNTPMRAYSITCRPLNLILSKIFE